MKLRVAWLLAVLMSGQALAADCTYRVWRWDTVAKRAVDLRDVRTDRAALEAGARDPETGCSVCSEDQTWVRVKDVPAVQVCSRLAPRITVALREIAAAGVRIDSLVGYRPGYTRGPVDSAGLRTGLSSHSFGISLDVDAEHNGLYDRCPSFGPACRLIRGGPWSPTDPRSLHADHPVVRALAAAGLRWGGVLPGQQKDFMHFSPRGD